jgi:hypothetical protein
VDPLGLEVNEEDVQSKSDFVKQLQAFAKEHNNFKGMSRKEQIAAFKDAVWSNQNFQGNSNSGGSTPSGVALKGNAMKVDKTKLGWRYIGYKKDGKEKFLDLGHFSNTMEFSSKYGDNITLLGGDIVEHVQGIANLIGAGSTANQSSGYTGEDRGSNQAGIDFKNEFMEGKYSNMNIQEALEQYINDIGGVSKQEALGFKSYQVPGYYNPNGAGIPKSQRQYDENHRNLKTVTRLARLWENAKNNAPTGSMVKHTAMIPVDVTSRGVVKPWKNIINGKIGLRKTPLRKRPGVPAPSPEPN